MQQQYFRRQFLMKPNRVGQVLIEEELDNSAEILQDLSNIISEEIKFFELISSDAVWLYVGQTARFIDQNNPKNSAEELQNFYERYRELVDHLLAQELTGLKSVIEGAKRILEPEMPPLWHGYLYVTSHNAHVTLVVVFDRPSILSEHLESNVLTIIPDMKESLRKDDRDYHVTIEGSNEIIVDVEEQGSLISLPSGNIGPYKDEMSPLEVEQEYLDPTLQELCETQVEDLKRLGKEFWICEYQTNVVKFHSDGTRIIDDEIKVLIRSGSLPSNHLRCLVWFGLGVEKNRNTLSLSFGDFLIIRSEQHPRVVAIVRLDWKKLVSLVSGLRTRCGILSSS